MALVPHRLSRHEGALIGVLNLVGDVVALGHFLAGGADSGDDGLHRELADLAVDAAGVTTTAAVVRQSVGRQPQEDSQ